MSGTRRDELGNRTRASARAITHLPVFVAVALVVVGTAACFRGKPALPAPTLPAPTPTAPPAVPTSITIAAPPDATIKAPMTVSAGADANPDSAGRPSPVVVRVYQLRADAAFSKAEFFTLFDDDQKALGQELISRDEFVLAPSEKRTLDVSVASETRFVAAIAAFRDIRNAQWRVVIPASRGAMSVVVERARVVLSVME